MSIRKIIRETDYRHRHLADVKRLQRVMLQNGYESDIRSAAGIWEDYSDDYAAGWLIMPEDDNELWLTIKHRVKQESV